MNIFKYILIGLTFDFGQALSGNPSEQFTISIVLNAESELLTTFLSSNIVPVACAGAVRNELLIASDENRTIIQTSDLELQLMQRFLFALVTQMDSDVYMAYMGFEDGTFLGYSNQGAIVDTGLYGALHASSFGVNSKNATTYDFNAPDRLCSTLNKTSFCGSVWTSRAPIGEPETWFTSLYDDYDVRTREWYIAGKEKSSGITKVYPFFSAGQGLTGYLDLRDANDVFVGVAAWDLRLAEFSRRAKSYIRQVDPLDELKLSVAVLDGILPNSTNRTILSPPPDPPLTLLALSGSPKAARGGNLKGTNRVAAVNATDDFVKHAARVLEQNGWQTNKVFIADHRFVYIIEMAVENILELSSAEPWWLMVSYEIQCPIGFYESESDEGCVLCEEPRTTSGRFSSFCDWCTSGMYLDERDNSCHDCPSNTDCDKPGVTLETLPLEEGYMRMHTLSDDVRYCVGSYSESDPGDTEICPGGPDAKNVPCDPDSNRVGPRCALCDHNYYMRSDECFRCRTTSLKSPSVMIPLIVYSLVVLLLLYWLVRSAAAHAHNLKRGNKYARLQAKIRTKWRILFVAVQILASMPDIVDAPYPKTFRSVVDFVGGIFTLDISLVIPFACLKFGQNEGRGASYYQRIVAFSLLPFFLMSLIILYVYWRQYRWNRANSNSQAPALTTKEDNDFENPKTSTEIRPNYRQAAMSVSILICFCLYPSISSSILSIFRKCEKWDAADGSGSRLYLIGDYRVKCSGSAYLSFRIYCAFFIAIWVVGVPLTYLTELYRHLEYVDPLVDGVKARMANPGGFDAVSKAMDIRSQNPIIGHLGVLFGPYEPQYWYWEVVECVRRLLSTAITMLVLPGSYNQIFFALFIALGTLKMASYFEPFFDDSDDILFEGLAWMVLFAQLIALHLRVYDNGSSASPMSIAFLCIVFGAILWGLIFLARDAHREKALYSMLKEDLHEAYKKNTAHASVIISKSSSEISTSNSFIHKMMHNNKSHKKRSKVENRQKRKDMSTFRAAASTTEGKYSKEESSEEHEILHVAYTEDDDDSKDDDDDHTDFFSQSATNDNNDVFYDTQHDGEREGDHDGDEEKEHY